MVFPDLSAPEIKSDSNSTNKFAVAAVADRCLALLLDFLIFSPVVSLCIAGLVKQTKTFFLLNSTSQEGSVGVLLIIATVMFLTTLLQAVFLYYWQATPGQIFLQLRVVAFPQEQNRLSLNQCLVRAFFFCFGFALFALPFLEILSHSLRRSFHERASDTMVVTLKAQADEGPHPIESRFIGSWMRMSFLLLALLGVIGFFKTYNTLLAGGYRDDDKMIAGTCSEIKETNLTGAARLDTAITLYLLEAISSDCLDKEAEVSLWENPTDNQSLAYLAKYLTAEDSSQDNYFSQVCATEGPICSIAKYMSENGSVSDLNKAEDKLLLVQFLKSEEFYTQKDYSGSLAALDELQKNSSLKSALEKRFVRSVWALNEAQNKGTGSGRAPASVKKQNWLETFKERYEFQ